MAEALGVLALTVAVHELGHFLAARTQNIHVTKFSIGFGPVLAKWQVRGAGGGARALHAFFWPAACPRNGADGRDG